MTSPNIAFEFSAKDQWMIDRAKANGIVIPEIAMKASRWTRFPFFATCATLQRESSGGMNVWGGDKSGLYEGHHGKIVTQESYRHYKIERVASGNTEMQGCGPMQLTWWELQDEADAYGGCYNPMSNVLTGVNFLSNLRIKWITEHQPDTSNPDDMWRAVYNAWNDATYAEAMVTNRLPEWRDILANPH